MEERKIKALFLDDIREPGQAARYTRNAIYILNDWAIVRNFNQFVEYIEKVGLPDIISFDHDLADEHYAPKNRWGDYEEWSKENQFKEKTGYDCAKWLVEYCLDNNLKCPYFFCHSMNPVGREKIISLLTNFKNKQSEQ